MTSLLLVSAALLVFVACSKEQSSGRERPLRVFAAASLTEPFRQMERDFEGANPSAPIELSFASTHQLLVQLQHGAEADVYATADAAHMRDAEGAGLVQAGTSRELARNRLLLVVPRDNPGKIESLRDVGRAGVRLVMAHANVPVGRYTRQLLEALRDDPAFGGELVGRIEANVVSSEATVKAVLAKVRLGEADAGFVYVSDAVGAAAQDVVRIELPERHNPVAHYEIAVLRNARNREIGLRFVEFALSADGQKALAEAGLLPPR